jgi:hypothetical protein
MSSDVNARLELARALRESADGSSEVALRAALSRSYYSIFHAAEVLLGKVTHENIVKWLGAIDPELAARVKKLRQVDRRQITILGLWNESSRGTWNNLGWMPGSRLMKDSRYITASLARLNGIREAEVWQ